MRSYKREMQSWKFDKARSMRKRPTAAELRLKNALYALHKTRGIRWLKWRTQHPCLGWILDFYCPKRKIAVEVDGPTHNEEQDAFRDRVIYRALSIKTIRVNNDAVMKDLDEVVDWIIQQASERPVFTCWQDKRGKRPT